MSKTDWPVVRLGDHVAILSGFAFDSTKFSGSGDMPLVRIRDVTRGRSETYYSGNFEQRYVVADGDLLIGMDGQFNIAQWRGGPALLNQRVCGIKTAAKALDERYMYRFLPPALKTIEDGSSFVTVKHLSVKQITEIQIPLPPLPEQRRIAGILDRADELRSQRRSALTLLDTLPQSIFTTMFGDPISNSMEFECIQISDICRLVRGSSPRPKSDPRFYGGPVPRLMIADITRDGWKVTPKIDSLTIEGAKRSRPVPEGTVVMAVSGDVGLVSRLAVDACVHDGFVAFTELDEQRFHPAFFLALLHFSKSVHEAGKAGAIFKNVTTTGVKATPIPVPPLPLQQEFARRVEAVERLKESHRKSLAELDALFASLQHRAFRGEL